MDAKILFECALYFLALINPISKIFILSGFSLEHDIRIISLKSTLIAFLILLTFAIAGKILLENIFHVDLNSLKIAGGIVLFYVGFKALTKGVFFESTEHKNLMEMSIVPIASPLIAGPATITATVSYSTEFGILLTTFALVFALLANLVFMLLAKPINRTLSRYNIMGALIRITGLVVATIAVQMVMSGITGWVKILGSL